MSNWFDFSGCELPLIAAPMAGVSTPALAAAATEAGGLGFLAGGISSAEAFAEGITVAQKLTSGPLGVNLFVPQPSVATADGLVRYAATLGGEEQRYGVALGKPDYNDDGWAAKLDVIRDLRPEVVSFTFGLPTSDEMRRIHEIGITTLATVTTLDEADCAVALGVEGLVAQGPDAGGHRGTYDPAALPSNQPLGDFLAALIERVSVPVVAAGGLATAEDVRSVLAAGAVAAQLGTAFLLSDEAGTSALHRAALQDPQFTETALTRTFTGRYARALRNRFITEHETDAVFGFPEVGQLTAPLRQAAARADDPHALSLWAGTKFSQAKRGSVTQIVAEIANGLV